MRMSRSNMRDEQGFTLALVMIAMFVISLITVATVTAVNSDIGATARDLDRKQAYEAAQAGIAEYAYKLNNDTNYWATCGSVPTSNPKPVPGGTSGTKYAVVPIGASTGAGTCSQADPVTSMIEGAASSAPGTFRIRATGYSGEVQQRIVATFKRKSFLDYIYFTQLETSDPLTYGYTGAALAGATSQCSKTAVEGRYSAPIPGTLIDLNGDGDTTDSGERDYCNYIYFNNGERINGPLHTNDFLLTCGTPVFGRTFADKIEIGAPDPGYYRDTSSGCPGEPSFLGERKAGAGTLTPPATNGALANVSGVAKYFGTTDITLSGTNMTVINNGVTTTRAIPTSGVVYVASDAACPLYSPFASDASTGSNGYGPIYPDQASGCGTVYVSGTYTGKLTIAAENDVIVDGNLCRGSCTSQTGDGLLGLIANNFVRVQHKYSTQTSRSSCNPTQGTPVEVKLPNPTVIDAAILAINHSFIVDHYNCGGVIGLLKINGAIAQKFRGPVGTSDDGVQRTGYEKNYTYDDRLSYVAPPKFVDPVQAPWRVQRETLDP